MTAKLDFTPDSTHGMFLSLFADTIKYETALQQFLKTGFALAKQDGIVESEIKIPFIAKTKLILESDQVAAVVVSATSVLSELLPECLWLRIEIELPEPQTPPKGEPDVFFRIHFEMVLGNGSRISCAQLWLPVKIGEDVQSSINQSLEAGLNRLKIHLDGLHKQEELTA